MRRLLIYILLFNLFIISNAVAEAEFKVLIK